MARVEIAMPQMGESIAEGTVSVWLKKVGETVGRDEPVMEIATDKVDAEIPSPVAGILAEILVQEGRTVEVGTVVAYIETDATMRADPSPPRTEMPEAAVGQPESSGAPVDRSSNSAAALAGPAIPPAAVPEPPAVVASTVSAPPSASPEPAGLEARLRSRSSPLVRRIAADHDVDLAQIAGSGRLGRVTKEDILRFVERGNGRGGGSFSWEDFYTHVEHPEVAPGPEDRTEPMSRMTQLIGEHMVLSRRISPHVHSYFEVDYSRIDQLRAEHRESWAEQGVKVSYTTFIAKAVATALREHPKVNAAVSGRDVIYRGEVNIGVAVALPWGLIVPVVQRADELSLTGIAARLADLAERARAKKLSPAEVQGGTFTITNPGIFGTVLGFPIINQPQVAILCIGGIEKRPVVIADEFGNDAIVARKRGFISLGYDHRLVNGADGDHFLARVKELLEGFTEGA